MRLTPAHLWSVTFGITGCVWIVFPPLRSLMNVSLVMHASALVWGVFDIRSCFFGPVLIRGPKDSNLVALTFDDGPDYRVTPSVLRLLQEFNCRATFFVVAERALRYPDIVQDAVRAGHTIGCHTTRHSPWTNFLVGSAMKRELAEAQESVASVIGRIPLLHRPPVGLTNPHLFRALDSLGMQCVGWSARTGDAGNKFFDAIRRIPELVDSGEIVLLHDTAPDPWRAQVFLDSLRRLLERMDMLGLRGETVDRMLDISAYR